MDKESPAGMGFQCLVDEELIRGSGLRWEFIISMMLTQTGKARISNSKSSILPMSTFLEI
jgi:hypothetical protein